VVETGCGGGQGSPRAVVPSGRQAIIVEACLPCRFIATVAAGTTYKTLPSVALPSNDLCLQSHCLVTHLYTTIFTIV
jgi:hypothetical protein